jgi:RNA polymerase sigma-70 factor (ECF subfamily)
MTQDVLFKVYRKVDAFRGDAQLSSWIYRITFNAAMSRLRTAQYQRAQDEDRRASGGADEDARDRRARCRRLERHGRRARARTQLRQRVFRAILALPAIYRAPVMLRDIQGHVDREASAMLK